MAARSDDAEALSKKVETLSAKVVELATPERQEALARALGRR